MNNVRSLVQAAHHSSDPGASLYSEPMLAELLALNEEMVEQLRLERLGSTGDSALVTGMIEQHEKAAAMLRLQLANHRSGKSSNGASPIRTKSGDANRPAGANRAASGNGSKASASAVLRLHPITPGPATGSANHARHHVSRKTQS